MGPSSARFTCVGMHLRCPPSKASRSGARSGPRAAGIRRPCAGPTVAENTRTVASSAAPGGGVPGEDRRPAIAFTGPYAALDVATGATTAGSTDASTPARSAQQLCDIWRKSGAADQRPAYSPWSPARRNEYALGRCAVQKIWSQDRLHPNRQALILDLAGVSASSCAELVRD